MAKGNKKGKAKSFFGKLEAKTPDKMKLVDSLLDVMRDGDEYLSIINTAPISGTLDQDLKRAIIEIEEIRKRPLLCYFSNVIKGKEIDINSSDDLPFNEMVSKIDTSKKSVDIIVVTPGGSGQQISQFVNTLRPRFDSVEFILPYMCMSAGTLWILSGDKIWMDKRAYIGPIDPQVRLNDSFIPAQSIMALLKKVREEGEEAIKKGCPIPWEMIRLLYNIDGRLYGDALLQSEYSIKMATEFLLKYKFKDWVTHSSTGNPVTKEEKEKRADEIAQLLCSNEYWKSHAHGITRETVKNPLLLKIEEVESIQGLERAVRRLWALVYWLFDRALVQKLYVSKDYLVVRSIILNK